MRPDGLGSLRRNPVYQVYAAELDARGIDHRVEWGGPHPKIVFEYQGKEIRKPMPGTLGDTVRGPKNARADIRRMLKKADRENEMQSGTGIEISAPGEFIEPAVFLREGKPVTTSKDIATAFDRQHKHVLDSIENLLKSKHGRNLGRGDFLFQQSAHPTIPGRKDKWFFVSRKGFALIAMGFSGERALDFKLRYIDRFDEMEEALRLPPAIPHTETVSLSNDTAAAIGGICKAVVRKQTEDLRAGQDLILDELSRIRGQVSLPPPRNESVDLITAFEVVSNMAEVPETKRFGGMYGQVSARLSKYCARHGYRVGLIDLRPGEKMAFPRPAVEAWLMDCGRREIWALANEHAARRAGQGKLRLVPEEARV